MTTASVPEVEYCEYAYLLNSLRGYFTIPQEIKNALGINYSHTVPHGWTEQMQARLCEKLKITPPHSEKITITLSPAEWEVMVRACEAMSYETSRNYYRRPGMLLLTGLRELELGIRVAEAWQEKG